MRHVVNRHFSSRTIPLVVTLSIAALAGQTAFAPAPAFAQGVAQPAPAGKSPVQPGFLPASGANVAPATGASKVAPSPAATVSAGDKKDAVSAAPTAAEVIGEYALAPGDVLSVLVGNHPEMSGNLAVTEAGKIALPTLGNLTVAGKSVAQAEKLIYAAISKELKNPDITVTQFSAIPRQVLTVGAFRTPGAVNLRRNWRVSEVIDVAGGLVNEPDNLVATLSRGGAQPQRLNLAKILESPKGPENISLKPGDILRVNLLPGRNITVAGDVKSPSNVTLRRSYLLRDAIVGAGDLTQKPETTKITVVRGGREIPVDTAAAFENVNSPANITLQNGDLVMVSAIRTSISVIALHDEVRNAGNFTMDGRPHVLQAVLAADIQVPAADLEVSLRRGAERIPVDLEKAAYDPAHDLPLQNGDVLLFGPREGTEVRVAGGVARPGEINLKKDATLLDAIFASGGISGKPEDVKLTILRENKGRQSVLSVDPVGLISLRDLGQNVKLTEGDLVMVNPILTRTVFIAGEVANPGSFQIAEGDGLAELLLRAGGPAPFAALRKVQILRRDNSTLTVDLSKANEPGATRIPVDLEAGDLVTVPKNTNRVLVMNAVARPGYIPFPENEELTIGDAILMAGGARERARLHSVALIRKGEGDKVTQEIIQVDNVRNKQTNGLLGMETPLRPGDIVYVPEGKMSGSTMQTALQGLTSLSVLRNVFGY